MDRSLTLFERYGYLFELRDRGTPDAVSYLCKGFSDESALLKHEIAFVLGQLNTAQAAESLMELVSNSSEHYMVRHEAAEALGTIGTQPIVEFLHKVVHIIVFILICFMLNCCNQYLSDDNVVVRESCEVALDISDFYHSEDFHYTDVLVDTNYS